LKTIKELKSQLVLGNTNKAKIRTNSEQKENKNAGTTTKKINPAKNKSPPPKRTQGHTNIKANMNKKSSTRALPMDTSSGHEDDGNEDDESAGDGVEFKKITDIYEKNKAWWVTFMMTDGEIVNGSLKTVKKDAVEFGFEQQLQDFADKRNIDLGRAPPHKKKRKNSEISKQTLPLCKYNHDDLANFKAESVKRYFNGTLETHFRVACKKCDKKIGHEEGDDIVVPTVKEPVYVCMGNVTNDCKKGLCYKCYAEITLKSENDSKFTPRKTRNN
jgi:hypothetical protein